jgi:hypothetical protein
MRKSIIHELLHIRLDRLYSSMHGRDSIALTLQTDTLAPDSSETIISLTCRTATMRTGKVRSEYKYLVLLEMSYSFWGISSVIHMPNYL